MIPSSIRPINEELGRLHRPVTMVEEDDDRLDTALQGFSITSVLYRPEASGGSSRKNCYSDLSWSTSVVSPQTVISPSNNPSRPLVRHILTTSIGSNNGYTTVLYPVQLQDAYIPHPPLHAPRAGRNNYSGSPGAYPRVDSYPKRTTTYWM